jgi:hypothetical protein
MQLTQHNASHPLDDLHLILRSITKILSDRAPIRKGKINDAMTHLIGGVSIIDPGMKHCLRGAEQSVKLAVIVSHAIPRCRVACALCCPEAQYLAVEAVRMIIV